MLFSKLLAATTSSTSYTQTSTIYPFYAYGSPQNDIYAGWSVDVSDKGTIVVGAPGISPTGFGGFALYLLSTGGTYPTTGVPELSSYGTTNAGRNGYSVSINAEDTIAISGTPYYSTAPYTYNGRIRHYAKSGGTWGVGSPSSVISPTPQTNSYFGWSTDISSDGGTIIVGSWGQDDGIYTASGTAFIYTASFSTLQATLLASDRATDDNFGYSVSISSDGNTALIGAYNKSTSPYTSDGAAYVFTRSGGVWTQQAKLLASDRNNNRYFGKVVSLSSDGNTAFVVASNIEAVYIFTRSGTTWTQVQKITEPFNYVNFAKSIANSNNGATLAIGSDSLFGDGSTGSVHIYRYNSSTSNWQFSQIFGQINSQTFAYFGNGLAMSSSGGILVGGAPGQNVGSYTDIGLVSVFSGG